MILERDGELAVLSAAGAAAGAGHGALVLVEGPAGIGKTTLLRAAVRPPGRPGLRILTARGLALERGFPYGIVRQLIEPVRAAAGPGEWDALLDGAAGLAARVFDWAEAGPVEDDVPLRDHARPVLAGREPRGPQPADDRGGRRALGRRAVAALARAPGRPHRRPAGRAAARRARRPGRAATAR